MASPDPQAACHAGAAPAGRWLAAALNQGWIYRDRVEPEQAGQSALAFYAGRYRHSSADRWLARLEAGEIERNGRPLAPQELLAAGDRLRWQRPPWREEAVPLPGPPLWEDGDLLVLDKPSGLPVLPAGGWLEHTLLRLLERRHRQDPAGIPRPVHRLGRFTSGLLVCARRPATRAWLSQQLRESTAADPWLQLPAPSDRQPQQPRPACHKLYRALLAPGALPLEPGASRTIRTPIGRLPHARLGTVWCASAAGGHGALAACSRLTLLERSPEADLVAVAIASGRPHQIRIHCAALGAPLLGDPLYRPGGLADPRALPGDGGYWLQAWRLELTLPTGEPLALEVERPLRLV